jgi:DNA-binding transcriptional LysR family regulator
MFSLQQLRYFVAVAEAQSVSRAGAQLNITQSPLSRQVQDLEARLGMRLFDRVRQRVRLTEAGRAFLAEAKALLAHAKRLEDEARAMAAGKAGPLRLGYVEGAAHAGVLRRILDDAPRDRTIELRLLSSRGQAAAVASGELDAGLTYGRPRGDLPLTARKLHEEPFLLAHPAGRAPETLDGAVFVGPPAMEGSTARADMMAACRTAGFEPDIRIEATQPSVVLDLVAAGLGLATLQASLARLAPEGVAFSPLPECFGASVSIWLVTADPPTAGARALAA